MSNGSYNSDDPGRPRWSKDTSHEDTFVYQRADGSYAFEIWKGKNPDGEKTFCVRRRNQLKFGDRIEPEDKVDWYFGLGDEPPISYCLPELIAATNKQVFAMEGEKDVETGRELGLVATCNPFGAGKWKDEYSHWLTGCDVIVSEDNDERGRKHAEGVALSVSKVANSTRVLKLPGLEEKGDFTDWVEERRAIGQSDEDICAELTELIDAAPLWTPSVSLDDFVAYLPEHNYIYMRTRAYWPGASVNARLPAVQVGTDDKGNPIKIRPAAWLDEHRRVEVQTWMPGKPMLIEGHEFTEDEGLKPHADSTTFNLYRPPTIKLGDPAGAGFWLDLIDELYPRDKEHIIACFAHARQKPHVKINHVLLLGGDQGIVERAVGFTNFRSVTPSQIIESRFNGEFKTVVLYISEVHDLGISDRIKFYNVMKDKLATPPTNIRIEEKYRQPYYVPNLLFAVTTTNFRTGGIYLPPNDRRHYVAWSEVKMGSHPADWWQKYYEWFDGGGDKCVAAYLQAYDLSKFNPKAEPLKTEAWHAMVNASMSSEELDLTNVLEQLGGRAATIGMIVREAIALDHAGLADWLRDAKNHKATTARLEEAGWSIIRNPDETKGRWRLVQANGGKTLQRMVYGPMMNGDGRLLSTNERLRLARVLQKEGEPAKAFEDPGG